MAVKNNTAPAETLENEEPTVEIKLPLLDDSESPGKVDQTVTVEINGRPLCIQRGEYVSIPVSDFLVMYESGRFKGQNL